MSTLAGGVHALKGCVRGIGGSPYIRFSINADRELWHEHAAHELPKPVQHRLVRREVIGEHSQPLRTT